MDNNNTLWENFELPSKGKIYKTLINPNISLRSMTTAEEMQRLSHTDTPYKVMSDIIENCMKEKPKIHVCDLSFADYQFLLHKLRIVTYGNEYKMFCTCPHCGNTTSVTANLEDLKLSTWDESINDLKLIKLPVSNYMIELKFQTPHDLDLIAYRSKEMRKEKQNNVDYSLLFTLISLIDKIDGREVTPDYLKSFVLNLPARDANYILNKSTELNSKVGLDNTIKVICPDCGREFYAPFRITSEFFGPTNY